MLDLINTIMLLFASALSDRE